MMNGLYLKSEIISSLHIFTALLISSPTIGNSFFSHECLRLLRELQPVSFNYFCQPNEAHQWSRIRENLKDCTKNGNVDWPSKDEFIVVANKAPSFQM